MIAILVMDLKRAMAINVRRERNARKLTQEELADRAGLSARYLWSIQRGTVSASVTVLGRIAQAFRIDPCELIRGPLRDSRASPPMRSGRKITSEKALIGTKRPARGGPLPIIKSVTGSVLKYSSALEITLHKSRKLYMVVVRDFFGT